MVFVELRSAGSWAIQGIVAASPEGKPVSKQMVKWVGGIKLESLVEVEAIVQKPLEPVKSTRVSGYELHLQKVYLVQTAPEMLGLTFASASVKAGRIEDDEDEEVAEKTEGLSQSHHPE
jgi:aspartyl-tRNA synthetase